MPTMPSYGRCPGRGLKQGPRLGSSSNCCTATIAMYVGRGLSPEGIRAGREGRRAGLSGLLRDKNGYVRAMAASALVSVGADAKPRVPVLVEALRCNDVAIRRVAAEALEKIGPAAKSGRRRRRPCSVPAIMAFAVALRQARYDRSR